MPSVLICGDRNWTDRLTIKKAIKTLKNTGYTTVIEGEARGADTIAAEEAEKFGFIIKRFPANWKQFGKAAGPIRNIKMLIDGKPDVVVYFHNNLTESKGTKHMVQAAKKAGIRVINGILLGVLL